METMSYPCSPLLSYPTHEEGGYFVWSPQAAVHEVATLHVDPSPDQPEDREFLDTISLDPNDFHHQDASGAAVFTGCDEGAVWGQENGDLVAIQEELMEDDSLSDLLLAGAEAVEVGDSSLASMVFSRLDDLLHGIPNDPAASSFHRLAYHFDQGLQSRISGACARWRRLPEPLPPGSMSSVRQIIQELSPFDKFAHFTANQAILDATAGDADVHVIDLNIGEGVQWPSLMSDLARHGGRSFRLTAIRADAGCGVGDSACHAAARRLSEFAESLNLPFQCSSLRVRSDEDLRVFLKDVVDGRGSAIISCDTTGVPYGSLSRLRALLLGCVRELQPKLVVVVEEELVRIGREASLPPSASFVDFFFEALHHFTAAFESLASCFGGGGGSYGVCLRLVEREMVGPRIQDFVGQYGSVTAEAGGGGAAAEGLEGFRPCELSACNVAQARMLVGLFDRGFGVVHENGRLALCWKSRPLTSVSVWTPV